MTKPTSSCPYGTLPDTSYWRRSVANVKPQDIYPVVETRFKIKPGDKLSTAGSCFAQHISSFMKKNGYNYFVTEPGHSLLPIEVSKDFNYGTFSARYGNIYTTRQLIQLLERAYGLRKPIDDCWVQKNHFVDPYRPFIQPDGFSSLEEFHADREAHYSAVRDIVEHSDVFVFTLGLTECWENTEDGMIYPICPGCGVGQFDAQKHRFKNLSIAEVYEDLKRAILFMTERNPNLKVLLTVSPVPLIATYEKRHVLSSNMYSKSVLRVVAQMACDEFRTVDYFPSYEIITSPSSRGGYYGEDLRDIVPSGVSHAMSAFFKGYMDAEGLSVLNTDIPAPANSESRTSEEPAKESIAMSIAKVICDEENLEEFIAK